MPNPIDILPAERRVRNRDVYYKLNDIKEVIEVLSSLTMTWEHNPHNGHIISCDCEECNFVDDSEYGWSATYNCIDTLRRFSE